MNDDRPPPTKDEWTPHDTRVAIFFALLFFVIGPAVLIGLAAVYMPTMRIPGNQQENRRPIGDPAANPRP